MMWSVLISALGLLLVFEGILPFLSPISWRRLIIEILRLDERALRIMGLISMLTGLLLVTAARQLF